MRRLSESCLKRLTLALTLLATVTTALMILMRDSWTNMNSEDPAKALGIEIFGVIRLRSRRLLVLRREATR